MFVFYDSDYARSTFHATCRSVQTKFVVLNYTDATMLKLNMTLGSCGGQSCWVPSCRAWCCTWVVFGIHGVVHCSQGTGQVSKG